MATNGNAVKIQYLPDDNLVERFATRLLRRELFEKLRDTEFAHTTAPKAQFLMFGSGVVQLYRPPGGFPISRQAKDLDLGFVMPNANENAREIPAGLAKELQAHIEKIAKAIGGQVERQGNDLYVTKAYSPDALRIATSSGTGRTEPTREYDLIDLRKNIEVHIKIPCPYVRSPVLPLIEFGDKGFYHEDVREVMGAKLYRMTSQNSFATRDVLDFYNLLMTGDIDLKRDGEILHSVAMIYIAAAMAKNNYDATLKHLEPTDENITLACKNLDAGRERPYDASYDRARRNDLKKVYTTVRDAVQEIFPRQRSTLPDKLAGELGFTLNELNFITHIKGVDHLPGGQGMRSMDEPEINPGLIVTAAQENQFRGLCDRIANKLELQDPLNETWKERNSTEQTPYGFGDF